MIRNFDEVKRQLIELSEAVNRFKAESVQLRIVELVLGSAAEVEMAEADTDAKGESSPHRRRRRSKSNQASAKNAVFANSVEKKKQSKSGTGPRALIVRFIEEGWFKQKRRIGAIVEHCSTKGKKLKARDISGKLIALVREEKLQRAKDAEGQWEYFVK